MTLLATDAHRERPGASHTEAGAPTARLASPGERLGWSVAAVSAALWAAHSLGSLQLFPWATPLLVALGMGSLAVLVRIWASPSPLGPGWQLAVWAGIAAAIGLFAASTLYQNPAYGTDEAAFDQYAASLVLHGLNPYAHSMAPAFRLFRVPVIFQTLHLDGTPVTRLSYPSGSFLAYLPLLALGVRTQAAIVVDIAAWLTTGLVAWRVLPVRLRWAAPVVMAAPLYTAFVVGGVTDALYLPFLLLAVAGWDRFPTSTGARRWAGPLALGVACTMKQTPWLVVPFLLTGVWLEARAAGHDPWRVAAGYAGAVSGAFTAVNLPWVLADPAAWLHGTLTPLVSPTIPDGQGISALSFITGIGGGNLTWFTLAGASALASGYAWFVLDYPHAKRAWVALVPLALAFSTRFFGSYLIMLLPVALVAATTVRPPPTASPRRRARWARWVAPAGLGVVTLAATAAALTTPAPLALRVLGGRSTGQIQTFDTLAVSVTNRTGHPVRPHFTIWASGHASTFWYPTSGGVLVVAAHARATITLEAPNTASQPGLNTPLRVVAYTTTPKSVSVSAPYQLGTTDTYLTPRAVDAPQPLGRPVVFTVQLVDRFGGPITKAGVPVQLGQVSYDQTALAPGEASINGRPEGQTPVLALTGPHGVARFTVVGVQAQPAPVYFQAWIHRPGQPPQGYSNMVSVQFTGPR